MVNSLDTVKRGTELIVAGTDAGWVLVFDPREKFPVYSIRPPPSVLSARQQQQISKQQQTLLETIATAKTKPTSIPKVSLPADAALPILAVASNQDGSLIFSAGIDDTISAWDPRTLSSNKGIQLSSNKSNINMTRITGLDQPIFTLRGHSDTVTSLRVSPDNEMLLSNSMDSTTRTWNIRPFASSAASSRSIKIYNGAPAGVESRILRSCWSTFPDSLLPSSSFATSNTLSSASSAGSLIASGAGDNTCVIWDSKTARLLYKLPGHAGPVTDVCFSPIEPVIATASTDGSIILGELSASGTRIGN